MNPDIYDLIFPIMFGIMAVFFLTIGVRGVLIKRPFLVSNRWWLSILFVVFVPIILLNFSMLLPASLYAINWAIPLILGLLLLRGWFHYRGYTVYAVTDTTFREGVTAALEKLQLPYEESLSAIRLTSIEADLQVSPHSWMGTGIIRVKQRAHKSVLREVVREMNEYFRISSVPRNLISCAVYLGIGVIGIYFAFDMAFFRIIF
ncbi:MAG: hypothetical protein OXP71_15200 [Candidatus Poribacteria bacterium]|nr:hypothetical protein [Candidatus Poribacteria bacterium]